MKTIFKEITAQLDAVPAIKWVDLEKGQMNYERPPVLFPAALVDLNIPQVNVVNDDINLNQVRLQVKLCFDYGGNTNSKTPAAAREASLVFFDIVEDVKNALEGFGGDSFNEMEFNGMQNVPRPDGHKTIILSFTTWYKDAH